METIAGTRRPEAGLRPAERRRLWAEARRDRFRPRDVGWLAVIAVLVGVACVGLRSVPRGLPIWIDLPVYLAIFLAVGKALDAIVVARYRPVLRRLRGVETR